MRNGRALSRWDVREEINPSFLSTQIQAGPLREYPSRTCWTWKPSSTACFMQDHLQFAGLPPIPPRNLLFAGPPPIRRATSYSQGHLLFARPPPICKATSHSQGYLLFAGPPPVRKATSHSQGYLLFARPPPIRKATTHSQGYLLFARPPPIRRVVYPIRRSICHSVQLKKKKKIFLSHNGQFCWANSHAGPPHVLIVQELCESRGGRPGLSVLTSLLVSVDVKPY